MQLIFPIVVQYFKGADDGYRYTPTGKAVANLTGTLEIVETDTGEKTTLWPRLSIFGDDETMERVGRIQPKDLLQVSGAYKLNTYEKKDGSTGTSHDIAVFSWVNLSELQRSAGAGEPAEDEPEDEVDDLPF